MVRPLLGCRYAGDPGTAGCCRTAELPRYQRRLRRPSPTLNPSNAVPRRASDAGSGTTTSAVKGSCRFSPNMFDPAGPFQAAQPVVQCRKLYFASKSVIFGSNSPLKLFKKNPLSNSYVHAPTTLGSTLR